ncbi:hypothetical protein [Rickettsia sp. TH2014]|uniref:hypothetical protein n=1 Tax=Rickettsia sp. TH2014 TaxID=1967503 RepID=UPI001C47CEE3|nr:hypothetical protein [Rickettsia sp. TH2014]
MAFLTKYILVNSLIPLQENYGVIAKTIQLKTLKLLVFFIVFMDPVIKPIVPDSF